MTTIREKIISNKFSLPHFGEIKDLSEDEETIFEKNLVWIFASRRSGTTWLGHDLLSHETNFTDEPLIGHHIGRFEMTKNGLVRAVDFQKGRADYFFSDKYKSIWQRYMKKLILNRFHAQFQDISRKLIIKEPTGSYASDILAGCVPNSKIIVLMRDGRDVLDSIMDALESGGWENQRGHVTLTAEKRMEFIKRHSKFWNNLMEILLKTYDSHNSDLRLQIQYEDLLKNTFDTIKKIYKFLNIDIEENKLEQIVEKYKFEKIPEHKKGKGKFYRIASPGKWKDNFNENEKSEIETIMGDTLRKLGYHAV